LTQKIGFTIANQPAADFRYFFRRIFCYICSMKKIYRSKYSWWIVAVMCALVLVLPCVMLFEGFSWLVAIVSVVYAAFFVDMMVGTAYIIEGDKLKLTAGHFFRATLDISKIKSITKVHTAVNDNSFAWSTDRLLITMPRSYKYMVSPADEAGFLKALVAINPQIQVTGL